MGSYKTPADVCADVCDNGTRTPSPAELKRRGEVASELSSGGWTPRGATCVWCGQIIFAGQCGCGGELQRHVQLQSELLSTSSQALDVAAMDHLIGQTSETLETLEHALRDWVDARRARGL
jgi:hypothetical protein